ncbi:MAG: rhomboid family intramembrane serine protease [Deltaproteobacteria bacterium]|nr:rhomboid family intramembrane serine protease [Deltaproteobacteria bacterium]
MIPVATNLRVPKVPWMTYTLLGINSLLHLLLSWKNNLILPRKIVDSFGLVPAYLVNFDFRAILTLFTCMFLHGDLMHLIGNMLFLLVFGRKVETQLEVKNFLAFYLASGVTATMTHMVIQPDSTTPLIGASGAISGILGAFLIYNPTTRITMILDPFFIYLLRRLTIRVPAWVFILIWFLLQLHFTTQPASSTVAFWAHIGGFLMGGTMALAVYRYIPKERFHAARRRNYD